MRSDARIDMVRRATLLLCFLIAGTPAAFAGSVGVREPVLKQIQLPHNYYWRELYIPQLTSGPSSAAWSPDGKSIVYSMKGSLWRQALDSDEAVELTHGPGYDYQPDWSPDGKFILFARHWNDAIHLVRLDLATGREQTLTAGEGVNLEPRISPDGTRVLFVSSAKSGHFDLYMANIGADGLSNILPLVAGRVSAEDRYYYSPYDHAINASWSPDGKRVYYVSNPEIAWGTGDIWSVSAGDPKDIRHVLTEETHWDARPELAHDGKRLLYVSYQGRQWRQLWLTTPEGKSPLPLTFGDFDRSSPRWSPDDSEILYISNEGGNVSLWRQTAIGGERHEIRPKTLKWKQKMAPLVLALTDDGGRPIPARVSVLGSDGRYYAPDDTMIAADDNFDRTRQNQARASFNCDGHCTLMAPEGTAMVMAQHGFAHKVAMKTVSVRASESGSETLASLILAANPLPARFGSRLSADLHVHMNYGGHYRLTQEGLARQARTEDLDIVYNLLVNKEQRFPDAAEWSPKPKSFGPVTIHQGQEYHTSYWGHLGLLHLDDHFLMPGFVSYRHTALASPWPNNGKIADLVHAQGALAGYVHPFDTPPDTDKILTNSLPADAAHGRVDYMEIVSFAEHMETTKVWYRLLNLGFRLPAGAGTDAMANYASLRGPVGLNRLFLETQGRDADSLKTAIREGRGFATNGPLLGLLVNGKGPGSVIRLDAPARLKIDAALRSSVDAGALELVFNGKTVKTLKTRDGGTSADAAFSLPVSESGWLLLRARNPQPTPWVQDLYPYATTNPLWIEVKDKPHEAPEDAAYFARWIDRALDAAMSRDDYNTEAEKEAVRADLLSARRIFEGMADHAR